MKACINGARTPEAHPNLPVTPEQLAAQALAAHGAGAKAVHMHPKNAEGVDSPQTCRDDQLRQFVRWLKANGASVETDGKGVPQSTVEVSPLFGYDEDSFAESWKRSSPKPMVREGLYLE